MANIFGSPDTGGSLAQESQLCDLVAQDPSDISVSFNLSGGSYTFPVAGLRLNKKVVLKEAHGVNQHLPFKRVIGNITYNGSFDVNTWLSRADRTLLDKLLFSGDEGAPADFQITITDRGNSTSGVAATVIVNAVGCMCTDSALNIGQVGTPISRSYSFSAFRVFGSNGENL